MITQEQAQMITALAIASRPSGAPKWDAAGVMAALAKVRHMSVAEVTHAALRAASDQTARTPGVISDTNSIHWRERVSTETRAPRQPKKGDPNECPSHPGQWAASCSPCRAETIAGERTTRADEPAVKAGPEAIAEIRRAAGLPQFRDPKGKQNRYGGMT